MITEEYYKPCSLCHNADCVWMGGKDTHKLCEDFQALSQEPTDENLHREREQAYMQGYEDASNRFRQEPCDDAISRDAAIEAVSEGCQEWRGIYGRCEELINALPSVTHKSGKWIMMYEPKNMVVCLECGKCAYMYRNKTSAFCPNCGAKMESEDK